MGQLAVIFGGTGFVGQYVARALLEAGWQVRLASRSGGDGGVFGATGVACNILEDADVDRALEGVDAAVNCVGTFDHTGANNFDAIQHRAAARVAEKATAQGVGCLVHISAIGADTVGDSQYARSKAAGEAAVTRAFPDAILLRPSVIFGPEDNFFNRFSDMAKLSPMLPVVGGDTLFQPVYVNDVAKAVAEAVTGNVEPGFYELGGPDVMSFAALMDKMLKITGRRRKVLDIPVPLARVMGFGFDVMHRLTGRLVTMPLTLDQVKSLATDNIVGPEAASFDGFGITSTAMDAVLPTYL